VPTKAAILPASGEVAVIALLNRSDLDGNMLGWSAKKRLLRKWGGRAEQSRVLINAETAISWSGEIRKRLRTSPAGGGARGD